MPGSRWESLLKLVLLLAILATAGPELVPAIEMATLLELLGALLFVTAFSAAIRMTVIDAARRLRSACSSSWQRAAFRHSDRLVEKAGMLTAVVRNSINPLGLLVFCGVQVWLLVA
jgi:hypothetical protein